jgi:hypothetical protein
VDGKPAVLPQGGLGLRRATPLGWLVACLFVCLLACLPRVCDPYGWLARQVVDLLLRNGASIDQQVSPPLYSSLTL